MTFTQLLQETRRQGVRLRMTAEGRLQAAGLTPELRPAVKRHRARLKVYMQGRGCTLEAPRIRWAYPPCTTDWYAWRPGADKEDVPPGLKVADWTTPPPKEKATAPQGASW